MKIVVCVKQVPDTKDIQWTEQNTIVREGLESIINPSDLSALTFALQLKNKIQESQITTITMGPLQAEEMLKYTIALGADEAILLSDNIFRGSDTLATARVLAAGINFTIPDYDLIICGQIAIDGETAQTPASLAAKLQIPHLTDVTKITISENNCFNAVKQTQDTVETFKLRGPALISTPEQQLQTKTVLINDFIKAQDKNIRTLTGVDININKELAGFKGSPTTVVKAFRPQKLVDSEIISFNTTKDYAVFLDKKINDLKDNKE